MAKCVIFYFLQVAKFSKQMTLLFLFNKASHKFKSISPAPPVTNIIFYLSHFCVLF